MRKKKNWTLSIPHAAEWAEIKLQASVTRLCHLHLKACLEYPPPPPPLQRSWRSRRRGAAWWLSCMACRYVNEIKNKQPARAETIIVTADSCPRDSRLPVALPSPPQFSGLRSSTSRRQKGGGGVGGWSLKANCCFNRWHQFRRANYAHRDAAYSN